MRNTYLFILSLLLFSSCYYPAEEAMLYEVNDNFLLAADSLVLQTQEPLHNMPVDTLSDSIILFHSDHLVVAEIAVIPEDSIDSVWVKVARDQLSMGWTHQSSFLASIVPDDPISQFIYLFSQRHLWYFLGLVFAMLVLVLWRQMRHSRFHMLYLNDIPSFYPTLLTLMLSGSAILYASIQRFVPETWVQFYYHPTLNPFGLPLILSLFICSFWLLIVLFLATLDEVYRQLSITEAILYLFSLMGICMACYLVFSLAALNWVGYVLYVLFTTVSAGWYFRHFRPRYICGKCGAKMHDLGTCSKCGTTNH